jgi:ABC-type spermidine/putrescine transport system permease subunit II
MIRLGVSPMINALGTMIVLVPLILVVIGTYFERRSVS